MARITIPYTSYFGINATDVPFENLDALNDTTMYIDPHAVRVVQNKFTGNAILTIDSFLDCLTRYILSGKALKEHIFTHFNEPKETHLGLSHYGYYGHAASVHLNSKILGVLSGKDLHPLINIGVFKHLENLPLFIKDIGNDITSDITTCLIFDALAQFTYGRMKQFPELKSRGTTPVHKFIWNPTKLVWEEHDYLLPKTNKDGLILIPKGWCRKSLSGTAERYYQLASLSYIQQQGPIIDGKPITKPELQKTRPDRTLTNIFETTQAKRKSDRDLIKEFWEYVNRKDFNNK